jgi:hypothetical protein
MKVPEQERRDWFIIPMILIIGFLCVIIAGQWALRFAPSWELKTNMDSNLDPNGDFLTRRPGGFVEPVDASILTQPGWLNLFLTPGASFATGTRFPSLTSTPTASPVMPTIVSSVTMTNIVITATPTLAFVFLPSTASATSKPKPTHTNGPSATHTPTSTVAFGLTPTDTSIPTATETSISTSTATPTATPTSTSTSTPTDTPAPVPTDPTPGSIGTAPDGIIYNLPSGGTLTLGITLVVNGHPGWDLVYYERPAGSGVFLDWVIVEISDGTNWYTIFNWGNNVADTNTNMDFNILSNPQVPEEPDQRDIPTAELYNSTGIAIDLDSIVPPGAYPYIRFIAPPGDIDNHMEIDAIQVLP